MVIPDPINEDRDELTQPGPAITHLHVLFLKQLKSASSKIWQKFEIAFKFVVSILEKKYILFVIEYPVFFEKYRISLWKYTVIFSIPAPLKVEGSRWIYTSQTWLVSHTSQLKIQTKFTQSW